MGKFLTTPEVAEVFRTSPETVRYWRHVGYGPQSVRIGRRVLYPEAGVQQWADEQLAAAQAVAA